MDLLHLVYMFVLVRVSVSSPERFIATECFGSVLSLSCRPGHRIKVVDDFFGVASAAGPEGRDSCSYVPGDCTITNNRYSSVIHRYCEGLDTCTRFQVDRRNCGANLTNYEQVEYECVPDADVLDICSRISMEAMEGYIATPNFPNEYPANSHCRCTLQSSKDGVLIHLAFTQFIIKYDKPCKDWVEVVLDGQTRKLCGAYRSTLSANTIELLFHSDYVQGHQGFWLNFKANPDEFGADIQIECGPEFYTTATTTSTSTTSIPKTESIRIDNDDDVEWHAIENRLENSQMHGYKQSGPAERNISSVISQPVYEADAIVAPSFMAPIKPHDVDLLHDNNEYNHLEEARRRNSRNTGVIIISICVGGIVLLIIILTALLCINRRKKPKHQTLSEKSEKIQQRLSSLSFYDSIPLYDSISRKCGVARAPPINNKNGNNKVKDCIQGPKCMSWKSDAPYWTTLTAEVESDPDSAAYAELDKQSRTGISQVSTPLSARAQDSSAYSLNLENYTSTTLEDISTHV